MTTRPVAGGTPGVRREDPGAVHILKILGEVPEGPVGKGKLVLPRPNRAAGGQPRTLWLGPGEFLVRDAGPDDLTDLAFGAPWHIADLTDGLAGFVIGGAQAATLMAKGSTLDVHPAVFGPDHCTRTRFAAIRTVVERAGAEGFRITAEAGYADYLQRWFDDAVLEFQAGAKIE